MYSSSLCYMCAQAARAKEFEAIATMQVADLSSRQSGYEEECSALRDALKQLQTTGDEAVETGQLQWAVLQARAVPRAHAEDLPPPCIR